MRETAGSQLRPPRTRVDVWVALALTVVGLGIACYLAFEHLTGTTTLACPETGVVDCAKVTTSSYSRVAGVPVAYFGVVFFVALLVLELAELRTRARANALARLAATSLGMVGVAYLVWAEVRLHAICLWCTAVHVITFVLFALSVFTEALRMPEDDAP
ncbi:MAG: hypothetical protein QOK15_2427 [Nocardioidaceae bacterium]|jgi:uncharacterized membrane protein|nr:hypothetical protein [Nocardioidaceae bacterium]